MLFSSLVFLFTFLPITLLVYYLVPRKVKNVVLLIASLIFYAWGEPVYIFLMLISILFNYFCGMDIALKAGRKSQVRSLIFTIVVNLFILGFFKYYGFIVTNLNAILPFYIPYRKLELPIGISFYTFQTLSYIIDVYRGNVDVQVNLIDFGTYVTMFPQLIAGPIVQYADVERQLRERKESLTMENPVVTIEMENGGIITAELYPDVAPQSVYNFISLANSGFYDGLIFHRVIPGFMIQGGCPEGTGMGGPGYCIKGEFLFNGVDNKLKHKRGVLSMARAQSPNSAGSQFFIMHQDAPHLDKQYAAFGKVLSGMEVVDAICQVKTDRNDRPEAEQKMKSVRVDTKGETYPEPKKLKDPYGRF